MTIQILYMLLQKGCRVSLNILKLAEFNDRIFGTAYYLRKKENKVQYLDNEIRNVLVTLI